MAAAATCKDATGAAPFTGTGQLLDEPEEHFTGGGHRLSEMD